MGLMMCFWICLQAYSLRACCVPFTGPRIDAMVPLTPECARPVSLDEEVVVGAPAPPSRNGKVTLLAEETLASTISIDD